MVMVFPLSRVYGSKNINVEFHLEKLAKFTEEDIISGLDANKNGKISKQEFVEYGLKKPALVETLSIHL
jgi:hypothetical protein